MKYFFYVLVGLFSSFLSAKLTVVTEDWPPYNYVDPRGKVVGSVTEQVERILQTAGVDYSLSVFPWARSYQMAQEQPNVLLFSVLRTPERETLFDWYCPIHRPIPMHFYRLTRNDKIVVNSIEDVKTYRVGVPRGDWNETYLLAQGFVEGKNLDVTASNMVNLQTLIAGRIDLILDAEDAIHRRLKRLGFNSGTVTRAMSRDVLPQEEVCMVLSKNTDEALKQKIALAFKQLVLHQKREKAAY